MNDYQLRFKILFDILLSIEDGSDNHAILLKTLRIMVRKLGCIAGAVFLPLIKPQASSFERAVSVPLQIDRNSLFLQATQILNEISPSSFLRGEIDPSPVYRQLKEQEHCYLLMLPGLGVLVLLKRGPGLSFELLQSLHPISRRLAEVCLAQQNRDRLKESDKRFRALVENAQDALVVFDKTGAVIDANGQAQKWFGLSMDQLRGVDCTHLGFRLPSGHKCSDLLTQQEFPTSLTWEQELQSGHVRSFQAEVRLGTYAFRAEPRALIWIKDISERTELERKRLQMEQERQRAQRLESLGLMTSGIAHDFNNMLAAISGHAELAMLEAEPESDVAKRLRTIGEATGNLTALTKQLLAFSGSGRFTLCPRDLGRLAEKIIGILRVSLSAKVQIDFSQDPSSLSILADAGQMEQLIMNLLTNAVEAYGDQEGVVKVSVRQANLDRAFLEARGLPLEPGRFVILSVEDHGCGMTPEQLGQAFEPFFTTKFSGRGLGLAAAHRIVRGHKGEIAITSVQGVGTKFEVLVPASDAPAEQPASSDAPSAEKQEGTVLLVDDQPEVLGVATAFLERLGYRVLCATNGPEAIRVFERHASSILAAVVDLTMPGMDGVAVYDVLHAQRPQLPVVFSSGYSAEVIAQKLRERQSVQFVQKPYSLQQLKTALVKAVSK
jgi:PAS domain S-box-containing protein